MSGNSTPSEKQSNPQERAAISQSTTPNPAEQFDTGTTLEVINSSSKAQTRIQTNTTAPLELVQHQDSQPPLEQLHVQANRVSPVDTDNPSDDFNINFVPVTWLRLRYAHIQTSTHVDILDCNRMSDKNQWSSRSVDNFC